MKRAIPFKRTARIFAALAVALLALVAIPQTSEARGHGERQNHRVVDRCNSCGQNIHAHRQVVGRDHCGRPIYGWVRQSHQCRHASHNRVRSQHRITGHHSGSPRIHSFYDFVRYFR